MSRIISLGMQRNNFFRFTMEAVPLDTGASFWGSPFTSPMKYEHEDGVLNWNGSELLITNANANWCYWAGLPAPTPGVDWELSAEVRNDAGYYYCGSSWAPGFVVYYKNGNIARITNRPDRLNRQANVWGDGVNHNTGPSGTGTNGVYYPYKMQAIGNEIRFYFNGSLFSTYNRTDHPIFTLPPTRLAFGKWCWNYGTDKEVIWGRGTSRIRNIRWNGEPVDLSPCF